MNGKTSPHIHDVPGDAEKLRALHVPGDPLLLANVWDPPTAHLVESTGMRAIATASAALAPANGYQDHGQLPPDVAFNALRRIVDNVTLPVTADMENGYGLSAKELVRRIAEAGACGLNIEDMDHNAKSLVDADRQSEYIAAIKAAGHGLGLNLVVNARIDVYFHNGSNEEGLERARKYFSAGADCVYPILLSDVSVIRRYADLGPVNVLLRPGGPTLVDLVSAGVSRISVGPYFFQLILRQLRRAADALRRLNDRSIWA